MNISINLQESVDYAEKINIYNDGEVTVYSADDDGFKKIAQGWKSLVCDAHEMPAYGVSLNEGTLKALNSGLWAEFVFNKCYEHNGMPFEKLLISVAKEYYGFNIIRYTSQRGYDGRCFYYDLVGRNMDDFYDIILKN